jgi:hypothetical protein
MGKIEINKLKKKLHKAIKDHGRDSPVVLEISQKLDLYIVKEMNRRKDRL